MAAKLKKGDQVVVMAGRDKGVEGVIKSVDPKRRRAVVAGVGVAVHHRKPQPGQEGGRIGVEMPVDLSNLMLVDPESGGPTRVGFRIEEGKKVRFAKKSGSALDG